MSARRYQDDIDVPRSIFDGGRTYLAIAGKTLTLNPAKIDSGYAADFAIVLTDATLEPANRRRDGFRGPPPPRW